MEYSVSLCIILYILAATACRTKVTIKLKAAFRTPLDAELYYQGRLAERPIQPPKSTKTATFSTSVQTEPEPPDVCKQLKSLLSTISGENQLSVLNELLQSIALSQLPTVSIPNDFLAQSLSCMQRLKAAGKYNILYGVARGFGTMRED